MSYSSLRDKGTSTPASDTTRKSLTLIFIVILMDIIGITILSPVAPQIVLRYSNSAVMVTMVTILYAAGQFFAAPFLGKVSDKVGRRPVVLISLVGQAAGYLIFAVGGAMWVLLLGRLLGGITSGNLSTSNAYIADISKPEERSKNFALISTAWSLGLILGPALGGLFSQISLEAPAFIAGGISLANAIVGFFLLKESLPSERRDHTPIHLRDLNPVVSIFQIGRKPGLVLLLLANAIFSFAFNGISSISALFVIEKFSAATWQVSMLMITAGVAIALSNSFLIPRWIPRFGERIAGTVGLLGLALAATTIYFLPLLWLVYLLNMVYAMMSSFVFPALATLSVEQVTHQESGRLLGVTSAVVSLMGIFGPLWAGLIYDHVMMGSPYWMGPIFFILAALILFRTPPRMQQSSLRP